ncbi:LOW QUALITY PROTEIN: membrane-associated kinase regulator 2 [Populus alba x Populus x berolinensis]|uniref:Membrane-associated kinase regulator 2 n=1 Tax=Populus alba x Populus x berolinensis TaxID=444605 RepID=A0AAD6W4S9_9ROSI|nr:LOW QUALITY PROTEIN: membrane-associated kinase regulator 2 [Populus alba x Populus x berolinensis]
MEAFSLLKYWRGGGIAVNGGGCGGDGNYNSRATTIVSAVSPDRVETDDENDDDDGLFLTWIPDEDEEEAEGSKDEIKENNGAGSDEENDAADTSDDDGMDEEREFNFTLSSARLVPIESSSLELNSKSSQFSVSLLKSATKFRVFMSGLKRKPNTATTNEKTEANLLLLLSNKARNEENGKLSRGSSYNVFVYQENSKSIKSSQQKQNSAEESTASAAGAAFSDDKQKFSKDVMQKYLKKLKFSGQLSSGSGPKTSAPPSPSTVAQKPITADNGKGEGKRGSSDGGGEEKQISFIGGGGGGGSAVPVLSNREMIRCCSNRMGSRVLFFIARDHLMHPEIPIPLCYQVSE